MIALRPVRIWGPKGTDPYDPDCKVEHPKASFHKFEQFNAICELPDGRVIVVAAYQIQFTDSGAS